MKIRDISYYLFESYKDAKEKFSEEEDKETVNQYLDSFKQLAKKGIVTGQEKDIGYWIKQGWYDFKEFVDGKSKEKTKSQTKQSKKKDTIIAHEDDEKMVVIPLTKDASCFYGKGTKWCTSSTESTNYFVKDFYLDKTVLIYIFMKNSGEKYAAGYYPKDRNKFDYYNELDQGISREQFESNTGLKSTHLKSWMVEYKETINKAMDLNNASEEVKLDAVNEMGNAIEYIDNPSDDMKLAAVKDHPFSIKHIDNPSEEVQLAAVKNNGNVIQRIDNPSEEVQKAAIKERANALSHIDNPSEDVQLFAVENRPISIEHIKNPSEKIQLAAIKNSLGSIIYVIENPTEKAKELHQELWSDKN